MALYEVDQAVGANTRIIMAKENVNWGVASLTSNYKTLNVVAGETLDQNLTIYESAVIRGDHEPNFPIRGTQKPGGTLPFELAPLGQAQLFYSLLGNFVSTTGPVASQYTHILKGQTSGSLLPSFSLEKGFTDLASGYYQSYLGCRVNSCTLNFAVDKTVSGTFDIMARETSGIVSGTILQGTAADQTSDPFTSVQVSLYEAGSAGAIATARSLTLTINNNLYGENFVLGSNKRANLKFGTRRVTFQGSFLFNDPHFYTEAINGSSTSLEIIATNGTQSYDFYLGTVELVPNNSSPKIDTDGPLFLNINGNATKDSVVGSSIRCTIVNTESAINT